MLEPYFNSHSENQLETCPGCVRKSLHLRGMGLFCTKCGWDSFYSCGADGFEVPLSDTSDRPTDPNNLNPPSFAKSILKRFKF